MLTILNNKGAVAMAFFSKQQQEPIPEVDTDVWSCSSGDCSGWMRANYSFSDTPSCPLCGGEMASEIRNLPEIK
ncbi:cold-shock protein [Alkalihalobacillus sp. R86527]|uniref:cold-shock protein n=1 Tax=Alkalihalobacillus sp. R86527 TaxID=3093863 RepID=UPI00366DD919